jgi:hypothetical protein
VCEKNKAFSSKIEADQDDLADKKMGDRSVRLVQAFAH